MLKKTFNKFKYLLIEIQKKHVFKISLQFLNDCLRIAITSLRHVSTNVYKRSVF